MPYICVTYELYFNTSLYITHIIGAVAVLLLGSGENIKIEIKRDVLRDRVGLLCEHSWKMNIYIVYIDRQRQGERAGFDI
jgi:hypothetical protein